MGAGTHSDETFLASRARQAPSGPGVYILLGPNAELLYIGKAKSLRRRLLDHARGTRSLHAREVRWLECADEYEASCVEADLIAALAPTLNAVMVEEAFTFICVEVVATDRIRIHLPEDASGSQPHTYGAFPHLGKGKHSWRAVRTNGGFSAFVRLIWAAFAPDSS